MKSGKSFILVLMLLCVLPSEARKRHIVNMFQSSFDKAQAPHEYTETSGGHTWRNWRLYLSDYMIKINQ